MSTTDDPMELTCEDIRDLAAGFVLDALEPVEAAAVRAHLASCDKPHPEIHELGSVLPALDASVPMVVPPASLKGRIMTAAAADLATRPATPDPVTADAPTPMTSVPERSIGAAAAPRRPSTMAWVVRIAAVLVIGVLVGWNLLLRSQLDAAQQYQRDVAAVVDLASQGGSLTAVLRPDGGTSPAGIAAIGADGRLAVAMRDLAPTEGTTVYEAWFVGPDGTPVALGSFTVGSSGTASFAGSGVPNQPGIVLGLTHEPGPGATTPTLPMVLSGTATSVG